MYDYDETYPAKGITALVGRRIDRIWMSNEWLVFDTSSPGGDDKRPIGFTVEGDCCSWSYFYDFVGVRWLLENGPVLQAYAKHDMPQLEGHDTTVDSRDSYTQVYGFVLVTESARFGEVTSLVSFRNDSNGYYGGWMYAAGAPDDYQKRLKELTENCFGMIDKVE